MIRIFSLFVLIILLVCHSPARSQIINNRLTLNASTTYNTIMGPGLTEHNSFLAPALYKNFNDSWSFSSGLDYRISEKIYISADFSKAEFKNWDYGEKTTFNDTQLEMLNINLSAKIINPFTGNRKLYGYYTYIQAGPSVSFSNISFENLVVNSNGVDYSPIEGATFKYVLPGIYTSAGIAIVPFHSVGVFAELGYSYYISDTSLTLERSINTFSVRAGVAIYFMKRKQYYY